MMKVCGTFGAVGLGCLMAGLAAGHGGDVQAEQAGVWQRVLRGDCDADWAAAGLAVDETGGLLVLERDGSGGGSRGRVRAWPAGGGAGRLMVDGVDRLGEGRASMLAWRGRVFLAGGAVVRLLSDVDGDGVVDDRREVALRCRDGGFGGMVVGPDGRVYGAYGGVIEGGGLAAPSGPAVFRLEPDGSGAGLVHRGLRRPTAPCFGDDGSAVLLDVRGGGEPVLVRLLDGGTEGADGPAGPGIGLGGMPPLGPVLGTAAGGFALVGEAGRPALGWWRQAGAAVESGAVRVGELFGDARLVDLVGDWNGRPHLLLVRDSDGRAQFEVFACGPAGGDAGARLGQVAAHLADPRRPDGAALVDLLRDPERRVRLGATLALTRREDGPVLLLHAAGAADLRSRLHALWGMGILARRGGGAVVPGDDLEFGGLPNDELARKAAEQLAPALTHHDPAMRVEALRMLAAGRRAAGLVQFRTMLADPDPRVREQALLTAATMRWRVLPSALDGRQAQQQPAAELDPLRVADVLAQAHPPQQLPVYARHRSGLLRLAAVEALRRAADPGVAAFLLDADARVAGAAVRAVEQAKVDACRPAVAQWLDRGLPADWDAATVGAALRCAAASGEGKRFDQLAGLVDGGGAAAAAALAALAGVAPDRAAGCAVGAVGSPDPALRQAAWPLLRALAAERSRPLIEAGWARVKEAGAAADTLELMETAQAVDAVRWRDVIAELGHAPAMAGGDPRRGRGVFAAAGCAACHDPARLPAAGWPRDRPSLLRTVLDPQHGAGTGGVVVERKDGGWIAGVLLKPRGADGELRVETAAGVLEIAGGEIGRLHGPAAPAGDGPALELRDLRDLLGWLEGVGTRVE